MITGLLITLVLGLLNAVFGLIPSFEVYDPGSRNATGDLSAEWGWADGIASYLKLWDLFMPVGVIFGALTAILGAKVFVALVQFIRWVWGSLPGKGT